MMVMMFSVTGGATLVLHIILFRHATENGYYKCFLTALPNPYLDFDESDFHTSMGHAGNSRNSREFR